MISKDELFEEIEGIKKEHKFLLNKHELDLLCFTKLNTKINRDYLDYSLYYTNKGYSKIYEKDLKETYVNKCHKKKDYFAKEKKISFSDNIITCSYE